MSDEQEPGPGHNTAAASLRGFVARIESAEEDIADLNTVKSGVFREAKAAGFDVKALREVVKRRRQPATELAEHDAIVDLYQRALGGGAMAVAMRIGDASATATTTTFTEDSPPPRARARTRGNKSRYPAADPDNPAFDIDAKLRRGTKAGKE